ncbi:THUMP domain-containing protein [Saccharopolyspora spinosa]|uniref:THUMP domain-containing protein n=1 Tax=Saccharopolyspora spinosa TaxID=60894 RepID=UPI00374A3AA6
MKPQSRRRDSRRDKDFSPGSAAVEGHIEERFQDAVGWAVDLSHPDLVVSIMIDRSETYLPHDRIQGQRNLPVGSSGRALDHEGHRLGCVLCVGRRARRAERGLGSRAGLFVVPIISVIIVFNPCGAASGRPVARFDQNRSGVVASLVLRHPGAEGASSPAARTCSTNHRARLPASPAEHRWPFSSG